MNTKRKRYQVVTDEQIERQVRAQLILNSEFYLIENTKKYSLNRMTKFVIKALKMQNFEKEKLEQLKTEFVLPHLKRLMRKHGEGVEIVID